MANETKALTFPQQYALTPANARVTAIALRFHWRAEALIRRIEHALPAVMEQQLYLELAGDFRIHPESFAKLLRHRLASRELQIFDLDDVEIGENLVSNRFRDTAEYLEQVLTLIDKAGDMYELSISAPAAAKLVSAFGSDAEKMLDSIVANIAEIQRIMKTEKRSDNRAVSMAISYLAAQVFETHQPNPVNALECFQDYSLTGRLKAGLIFSGNEEE